MKNIKLAVIGTGIRSNTVIEKLAGCPEIRIESIFDPDMEAAQKYAEAWNPKAKLCSTFDEAIRFPGIDWVMVFSPNAFHKEHICAALQAGKHVFSEKPLATTIKDCKAIYDASLAAPSQLFATGFVLRYAPIYRKVKELIDEGFIGDILSIDANENITPGHGSGIMCGWRRDKTMNGPHVLEKCCHDLDLINWFTGSLPSKVAAFGGLDFFIPKNVHFVDKFRHQDGSKVFVENNMNPFLGPKSIMDNLVSILQYRNGVKVQFQATMSNSLPERRMYIAGTEGTIRVELYSMHLEARRLGDSLIRVYPFQGCTNNHGDGDRVICGELVKTMLDGSRPKCGALEGLNSAVTAIAIDEAAEKNKIVDLEATWRELSN